MRVLLFAAIVTMLALASGCQSSGGAWRWPWQSSGPLFSGGPPNQTHPSYAMSSGTNPAGAPTMEAGVEPPAPSFFTNPVGAMSAGFSSASKAVSAPFRSTPAAPQSDRNDPTRLGSPTGPITSATLVSFAKMKEKAGDLAGAEEYYRRAVETDPNDLVAMINYGRLFHRLEKWERAIEVYRRAVQLAPQDPVPHNDLAMCYASQGKLSLAIESATQAVQLDPRNPAYRSNLAMLLCDAKRPQEALTHLSAVHPAEIAHYNLAYLLIERGEKAQARQHLQIALQIKPQFMAAQKLIARTADAPVAAPVSPAGGTPAINVGWPAQANPNAGGNGGFYNPNFPGAAAPNTGIPVVTPPAAAGAPTLPLEGPRSIPAAP